MTEQPRAWWTAWWMAVPLALAAAVAYPITANFFFGDDLLSLYQVINMPFFDLLLVPYAGHLYIVRNALFTLMFRLFGPDPHACYWLALLTHLANVAVLCLLVRALTASDRLACFGAVLWGTAPITEGTIGWYSVYGHALATTAMLLVLLGVVRAGRRGTVSNATLAGWAALVFVAGTSFGIGLAFVLLVPIVAWLLMPAGAARRRAVRVLCATALAMTLIYIAARYVATVRYGADSLAPTPGKILAGWLGIADLVGSMLAYGSEQLVLGPLAQFAPNLVWPELLALPVLAVIALAFRAARAPARRAMLAFALLAAAIYGIIAVGRLDFYPDFKLMIMSTSRYHYAAPLMIAIVLCLGLAQLDLGRWASQRVRRLALAVWLACLVAGLIWVRPAYQHFNWARQYTDIALNGMRQTIGGAPRGGDVYIENQRFRGVGPMVQAVPANFPGLAALFIVYYPRDVVDGHRVFFVERDADVLAAASHGVRSSALLISPDAVPAGQDVRQVPPPPTPAWRFHPRSAPAVSD